MRTVCRSSNLLIVARPHVRDFAAVVDALRRDGAVYWPFDEMPADFADWRRSARRAARAAGLRVSIRRGERHFWIEHVDHEQTEDERWAVADVMDAVLRGQTLSFEDAVRARARQRIRLVHESGSGFVQA